jgi:hypothetical protein
MDTYVQISPTAYRNYLAIIQRHLVRANASQEGGWSAARQQYGLDLSLNCWCNRMTKKVSESLEAPFV